MDNSLFSNLILNISFLVVITHISSRISILKRQFLKQSRSVKGNLLLILFFSMISILCSYIGVGYNGAIVNTRSICVISAGLLCGPTVGMGSAIITGLHRWLFDIGGFTAFSCACSTIFVEGILGSVFHRRFQAGKMLWVPLVLLTAFSEIGQMAMILLIAKPFSDALALVQVIALPMIVINSLGIVAFIGAFQYIYLEQASFNDHRIREAMSIAEQCLPHLRKGLSHKSSITAATEIICQNSSCTGVAITDTEHPLSCYGELYLEHIPAFIQQAMEEKRCIIALSKADCPELAALLSKQIIVAAPLINREQDQAMGCLVILESKRFLQQNEEHLFAESLASLFSTQLELAQMEYQKQLLQKAEFKRLQSQVDPHFLFNSLNTISYFCRSKPDHAKELLLLLAKYYRFATKQSDDFISLSKELEQVDTYLQLEKARFEEKLTLEREIPNETLLDIPVPSLILQPLVENAIRHGVSEDGSHYVCIRIVKQDTHISIEISDHGPGFPDEIMVGLKNDSIDSDHVGLINVYRRLKCIYGGEDVLSITNNAEGATVTIRLPFNKE